MEQQLLLPFNEPEQLLLPFDPPLDLVPPKPGRLTVDITLDTSSIAKELSRFQRVFQFVQMAEKAQRRHS
jgi:hypothetical protein